MTSVLIAPPNKFALQRSLIIATIGEGVIRNRFFRAKLSPREEEELLDDLKRESRSVDSLNCTPPAAAFDQTNNSAANLIAIAC